VERFLAFLIGVRGLHDNQLQATNWNYSVAMLHAVYTFLTTGGMAPKFTDREILVMLICALCYGANHRVHDPFLVHTPAMLEKLQAAGPQYGAHETTAKQVFEIGQSREANIFGSFRGEEIRLMEHRVDHLLRSSHILVMTETWMEVLLHPFV